MDRDWRQLTTQAAAKHLDAGASIINVGSAITSLTPPNSAVYSATKGAVDAITGVLAKEFGPRKIRVNSINPGIVETEGTHTHGIMGSDFETTRGGADAARARGTARRRGGCGGVPGVERFAVVDWGEAGDFGGDAVGAQWPRWFMLDVARDASC